MRSVSDLVGVAGWAMWGRGSGFKTLKTTELPAVLELAPLGGGSGTGRGSCQSSGAWRALGAPGLQRESRRTHIWITPGEGRLEMSLCRGRTARTAQSRRKPLD